jgi:hypothetical protein
MIHPLKPGLRIQKKKLLAFYKATEELSYCLPFYHNLKTTKEPEIEEFTSKIVSLLNTQ